MKDTERQTGRTTKQIINAPKNSIYICHKMTIPYNKRIAQNNNREDITFLPCDYLTMRFRGIQKFVIIDHAIIVGQDISHHEYDYITIHNHAIAMKKSKK
jgi:hypothetical protein